MSMIQFLILLLIFAVFIMLIGTMMHRTYSYNLTNLSLASCQDMYSNQTIMEWCYKHWGPEIDP